MQVPVENKGKSTMYVAGKAIAPGETRHFEENDVPHAYRPRPAVVENEQVEVVADVVAGLLARLAGEVVAGLKDLSNDDLSRLGQLEADSPEPREEVMRAAQAEYFRRTEAAEGASSDAALMGKLHAKPVKDILPALAGLKDEQLGLLEELEKAEGEFARKTVLEAISGEILKRAGDGG